MPSTFEQLTPTRVKFTVEIPFADLQPALKKAYKDIAEQVNIPGFRKGKVPAAVIDQRFGRGVVLQEAINDVIPGAYNKAVADAKVTPLAQPEVEVTKLEDNDVVEFVAEVDVRPDFELPDFSTITATVDPIEVSDADVDERIELLRERFATNVEVDRPAEAGDMLVINLVGRRDGVELENATAENINYKVGSEGMIEGLAEAVTGLSTGESAVFSSTLVGGAERGQEADIEVTVVRVQEQKLPDVDDDFAQLISEFDTVDEMRADLRGALEAQKKSTQAADARDRVLEEVLKVTEFPLPEALTATEIESRRSQVTQQLAQAGLTVEQYLEDAEDETAKTAEEFWADIEKRALDALRAQIVLEKYSEDLGVQIDQQDLTELLFRKAQQNGTSPEQEANHMIEHDHMAEWMGEIRRSKALKSMVDAANVVDSEGNPVVQDEDTAEDEDVAEETAEV